MKRRFISAMAVALSLVLCFANCIYGDGPVVGGSASELLRENEDEPITIDNWKEKHEKVRGVFVSGPMAGSDRMDGLLQLIENTDLNAIVLDVKEDGGNITFNMNNENVMATNACIPYIRDIESFLENLKANDIYVIARIPCFKDPVLAESRPDLCLRTLEGDPVTDANGNAWVNPCKEEVWDYLISIVDSCCELGFDEIQLDYVRFPVGQNADKAWYGVAADDDKRQDYINEFLGRVSDKAHEYDVPVAADVFGTIIKSSEDSNHIGQDYVALASSLDAICPMIYPSHYANGEFGIELPDAVPYDTIYAALSGSQDTLSGLKPTECAVVRPWLQGFTATWIEDSIEYGSEEIQAEIQAVYDAGYDEWIIWNSKCNYDFLEQDDYSSAYKN